MKYLLNNTPTSATRVEISEKDQPNAGTAVISQTIRLEVTLFDEAPQIVHFLQEVAKDKSAPRQYGSYSDAVDENKPWRTFPYILEYNPDAGPFDLYRITHKATGREITMGNSTARRLLDALTGNTERLVKEE